MTERPTIRLTNVSEHEGPGRRLFAVVIPVVPAHYGLGCVYPVAPDIADLHAVMEGTIGLDDYRARCRDRFWTFYAQGLYVPDQLRAVVAHTDPLTVSDGDTLFCACPGSPQRRHSFCHLELLAPFLSAAGWTVVLYGEPFTLTSE